jgi:hypothetical protein
MQDISAHMIAVKAVGCRVGSIEVNLLLAEEESDLDKGLLEYSPYSSFMSSARA